MSIAFFKKRYSLRKKRVIKRNLKFLKYFFEKIAKKGLTKRMLRSIIKHVKRQWRLGAVICSGTLFLFSLKSHIIHINSKRGNGVPVIPFFIICGHVYGKEQYRRSASLFKAVLHKTMLIALRGAAANLRRNFIWKQYRIISEAWSLTTG